jgi:hypothetical protein
MALPVTARSLITGALMKLGAISFGGGVPAEEAVQDLIWLNEMIDGWGLEPGTIPFELREVFALTPGRGSSTNPYTIGPGSTDFNTVRPEWLNRVGLLQLSSSPHVELPRNLLTQAAYDGISMKDLQSSYFTGVYYQPTFPLGSVFLYPVPNTSTNSLVLYSYQPIATFATLDTQYIFPAGYVQTLEDNLAVVLSDPYARSVPPAVQRRAGHGLSALKRANAALTDLAIDPALTGGAKRPWNILSDA